MRLDDFDYNLPEDRIALRPASPRDSARLLVVRPGAALELEDRIVRDLPDILAPGDTLVFNDTRVIPAQLNAKRVGRGETEPEIGITLHKRESGNRWRAFAKPGRKLAEGDRLAISGLERKALYARVEEKSGGEVLLAFEAESQALDALIDAAGVMPLPPYIASRRPPDERDREDYQTMFAAREGAVAAPTAGLHFTPELMDRLHARGIGWETVTLHVGAGTFLPVKVEDIANHRMHAEWGEISAETADKLNETRARRGRIVCVGTTCLRILETAVTRDRKIRPFSGETDIFITPGHTFRAIDVLMTNFHLPRSTLVMLVAAFSGLERIMRAYEHAVESGYRFYSYGDACLLWPDPAALP
ncbi:tRNA preQ1(34) S-adenosylmethionine ribosyltransferase-isomerase QueA [Dichotomicrobium thermohalophilum]|uniref:tRNA preQ1(34) S-adenosylmethionine ribosyltransferase-isomerase QueA n=1 Tax=Dichotomicrobium thermohalophilum TaxID=933063 RepID=UPI000E5ABF91|nr:tRNA preQ1(34) S-adenosylmethionine ribosyltransferase-isomerase QueA [Dichotomicrobium thermohalophilum]